MPKFPLLRKVSAEALVVPTVVVLVGVGAFGLGRLSAAEGGEPQLVINTPSQTATLVAAEEKYVASKSGTKYYLPHCSGAARILPENLLWFATVAEAQVAGYTAAANCSGL